MNGGVCVRILFEVDNDDDDGNDCNGDGIDDESNGAGIGDGGYSTKST